MPHSSKAASDLIVAAYLGERVPKRALEQACRTLNIAAAESDFSQLQAAAGTALLCGTNRTFVQQNLNPDGTVRGDRRVRCKRSGQRIRHLFTIEWSALTLPRSYFVAEVQAHNVR